jgi:hypothetical protein
VTPFVGAFLATAVAALVGMFSRQATEKLLKTSEAIFTVAPEETEGLGAGALHRCWSR